MHTSPAPVSGGNKKTLRARVGGVGKHPERWGTMSTYSLSTVPGHSPSAFSNFFNPETVGLGSRLFVNFVSHE